MLELLEVAKQEPLHASKCKAISPVGSVAALVQTLTVAHQEHLEKDFLRAFGSNTEVPACVLIGPISAVLP